MTKTHKPRTEPGPREPQPPAPEPPAPVPPGPEATEDEIEYVDEDERLSPEPEAVPPAAPSGDPAPATAPSAAAEIEALKERLRRRDNEIEELRRERAALQDQSLRRLAEMENLRKRFERERTEYRQYALTEMLVELLTILDNFERAFRSGESETDGKTFREGVELIYRMFQNLLQRSGVKPYEPRGREFDPAFEHAMSTEESDDVKSPEVAEVLQKGYLLHNRLLRPALVKVVVPRKG